MRKQQQGISMLAALVLICVVLVLGTAAARLLPIYLDCWTLNNIIDDVVEDNRGKTTTPAQVRQSLSRHFTTNRIESVSLRDIEISTNSEGVLIDASHEKRTPLILSLIHI